MAAHGRFGQPCPVCGAPIQPIEWPRTLEEMERWKPGSSS
jgi:hypothetical protein